MHCPICDKEFDENAPKAALPFCSMRCKLIDAARWLDEKYSLPIEPGDDVPSEAFYEP
ncbi:MAG: DNA gyrase inhibitor YacG [Planctomycetaceae bacterium]|jgi:endogenous inhibitor of DNA gyrase (YacG/DUF329 family)|nr:DNA gyrase inhibitor YacG [Planctomycetaceae bacterium]